MTTPVDAAKQETVRAATGTALDWNSDWSALFDAAGIPAGQWNGRMLAWINGELGTSYPDLPGAMNAFAAFHGFDNWTSMGDFSILPAGEDYVINDAGDFVIDDSAAYVTG
jgi:hypothetical protein